MNLIKSIGLILTVLLLWCNFSKKEKQDIKNHYKDSLFVDVDTIIEIKYSGLRDKENYKFVVLHTENLKIYKNSRLVKKIHFPQERLQNSGFGYFNPKERKKIPAIKQTNEGFQIAFEAGTRFQYQWTLYFEFKDGSHYFNRMNIKAYDDHNLPKGYIIDKDSIMSESIILKEFNIEEYIRRFQL